MCHSNRPEGKLLFSDIHFLVQNADKEISRNARVTKASIGLKADLRSAKNFCWYWEGILLAGRSCEVAKGILE